MDMADITPEQQEAKQKATERIRELFSGSTAPKKTIAEMRASLLSLEQKLNEEEKKVPNAELTGRASAACEGPR